MRVCVCVARVLLLCFLPPCRSLSLSLSLTLSIFRKRTDIALLLLAFGVPEVWHDRGTSAGHFQTDYRVIRIVRPGRRHRSPC